MPFLAPIFIACTGGTYQRFLSLSFLNIAIWKPSLSPCSLLTVPTLFFTSTSTSEVCCKTLDSGSISGLACVNLSANSLVLSTKLSPIFTPVTILPLILLNCLVRNPSPSLISLSVALKAASCSALKPLTVANFSSYCFLAKALPSSLRFLYHSLLVI